MNYALTKHSRNRCKERLGVKKSCTHKLAKKALINGINYSNATGALKKYIASLYESNNRAANNIIIYNRDVYVFKDRILITIFHVPTQYYRTCDDIQKKIKKMGD